MFTCRIVTPYGLYREVECSILNVRTTDGERGILANHMPLVTMLEISHMNLVSNNERQEFAIGGGMLYFDENRATLLVSSIESKDEIDIKRALDAKERAEGHLNKNDPNNDLKRAELALKKAINRISLKQ